MLSPQRFGERRLETALTCMFLRQVYSWLHPQIMDKTRQSLLEDMCRSQTLMLEYWSVLRPNKKESESRSTATVNCMLQDVHVN
jgi:hypothetical protein